MPAKKKTAKKAAAVNKSTKKRAAPSRPCIKCGKPVHPRSKQCGSCGADQPKAKKSAKKAAKRGPKAAPAKVATAAKNGASAWDQLVALKTEIDQMENSLAAKKARFAMLKTKI